MGVQPKRDRALDRPLLESEIKRAQAQTRSGKEASRYLNVHYETYRKYAKLYGIFEQHKNEAGIGISRKKTKGLFGLESILNGEHPTYSHTKLKERLIRAGYLEESCALCGFAEKRVFDGRCPLIMHCMDGNNRNLSLDNLQLRCYNCTALTTGRISSKSLLNSGVYEQDVTDAGLSDEDILRIQNELMGE